MFFPHSSELFVINKSNNPAKKLFLLVSLALWHLKPSSVLKNKHRLLLQRINVCPRA